VNFSDEWPMDGIMGFRTCSTNTVQSGRVDMGRASFLPIREEGLMMPWFTTYYFFSSLGFDWLLALDSVLNDDV
jgi:hypothetical protein